MSFCLFSLCLCVCVLSFVWWSCMCMCLLSIFQDNQERTKWIQQKYSTYSIPLSLSAARRIPFFLPLSLSCFMPLLFITHIIYHLVYHLLRWDCNLTLARSGQVLLSVVVYEKLHMFELCWILLSSWTPLQLFQWGWKLWMLCGQCLLGALNLGANDCTRSWWRGCNAFLPPAPASQDWYS